MTGDYYRRLFGQRSVVPCGSALDDRLSQRIAAVPRSGIVAIPGGYSCAALPLASGVVADVTLLSDLLVGGVSRSQEVWWSSADLPLRTGLLTGVSSYQIAHRLFAGRDAPDDADVAVLALLHDDWTKKYPHSGTRVTYRADDTACVTHRLPDGTTREMAARVPDGTRFNDDWHYVMLASRRPEADLLHRAGAPADALEFLAALFGDCSEVAGAVWQYVAPRHADGSLREVRLWIPAPARRPCTRALVLGVGSDGDRFNVDADGSINDDRPARGVAVAQKISSGNTG